MQKEFDIKWKSRDLSGSASLALWANMNQSTTQLGSKRQSQGKHLYPAINIFICCAVIVCQVSKYFYVSYFFLFLWFLVQDYTFYFFFGLFSPRWFSCLRPSCPLGEFYFKSLWSSSLLYVLLWSYNVLLSGHSLAWTFFHSSSVEAVLIKQKQ